MFKIGDRVRIVVPAPPKRIGKVGVIIIGITSKRFGELYDVRLEDGTVLMCPSDHMEPVPPIIEAYKILNPKQEKGEEDV